MKKLPSFFLIIFILLSGIFFSCKKESSFIRNTSPEEVAGARAQGKGKPGPPVANAGPDTTIILTTNTATLNGSASTDPNNDITNYYWHQILGPSSTIANANAVQTQVTNLVQGIYQFALTVVDSRGWYDTDTVQITALPVSCGDNRPTVNANLVTFGTLSQVRSGIGIGAGAGKIVFAGGDITARVDFFDINTQGWSIGELSEPRAGVCVAAVDNKIFFAGGGYGYWESTGGRDGDWVQVSVYVMDIYDVTTNTWSVVDLPYGATYYESAVVGNKIFFSDGSNINIYDVNAQSWSTTQLSDGRSGFSMVTANNKVYFAGGSDPQGNSVNRMDIYDNANNTWSVSSLSQAKSYTAGIAAANKVYFAGGYNSNTGTATCSVDIIDANTGAQPAQYLSRQWSVRTATMNNKIAFIPYQQLEFDIYNILTNTWSIGILTAAQSDLINQSTIFSSNNTIYVTGSSISNIVYKLEF